MVSGLTWSVAGIFAGDLSHERRKPNAASICPVLSDTRATPPVPPTGAAIQPRNGVLRANG